MSELLWTPSPERISRSNLNAFFKFLEKEYGQSFSSYWDLWRWSIHQPNDFWQSLWSFFNIIGDPGPIAASIEPDSFFSSTFFPHGQLNFTENILAGVKNNDQTCISYQVEDHEQFQRNGRTLHNNVHALATALEELGITPKDRVAGYLPNMPQTIEACLATAGLGAIWTSTSPDFGVSGALDRFSQVEPKVLFCIFDYTYKGKIFKVEEKLAAIIKQLPSLEHVIGIGTPDGATQQSFAGVTLHQYQDLIDQYVNRRYTWQSYPFDHPLFILYSSGTTGKPKCIVHGAGGTLLQHRKEHLLHCDIKPDDSVFFATTCGWMMWNWLLSTLACGCRITLFDGSPFYPDPGVLWRLAEKNALSFFGTSAKYLDALEQSKYTPIQKHQLSSIRTIATTGSPLLPEQFDFVYRDIAPECHLASICGGTDIISCFILGAPILPVVRGEIQAPGLGMAVAVMDENKQIIPTGRGELVCLQPFPSKPVYFWNDEGQKKYREAYFTHGDALWQHGDFVEQTEHHGYVIHGRSDSTLNPGGIRIGTAELYRQITAFEEIEQSVAVGQKWENDVRIVLFVKMMPETSLSEDLINRIKSRIRTECSARHVPAKILAVPDIPITRTGKISEKAVSDAIHEVESQNQDSLQNPESLESFKNLSELQL